MKNWQRTLLIGFIWGAIFLGWWANGFLKANWTFNMFSLRDWGYIADEFQKGWVISSTSDWLFFSVLLASFILFAFGWRYFLGIKWIPLMRSWVNRIIFFFTGGTSQKKKRPNKIKLEQKSSKTTRPQALESAIARPTTKQSELKVPVEGVEPGEKKASMYEQPASFESPSQKTSFSTSAENSSFSQGFSLPSMGQNFGFESESASSKMDDFENILLDDIRIPERVKLEENIPELFSKAGYQVLQNIIIDGSPFDYIAVGGDRLIACVVDAEAGDWLADEEKFNGEDPLWFSESSHRVSPVYKMMETLKPFASKLTELGYTGVVTPMFILKSGTIINAEDMIETWKELSVIVSRTDMGGPDEIKSVGASVPATMAPSPDMVAKIQSAL